jgi:methionyl-tRNA formyltransferase
MAKLGAVQLIEAIRMINEGVDPKPQQGQMSLAPKIAKSELRLNLSSTSAQVMCQIRAFTKQPGVWFVFQGQRVIITKAKFSEFEVKVDHLVGGKDSLFLGTNDGSIEIERVIPEGKREMSGGEFARGRDLTKACPVE